MLRSNPHRRCVACRQSRPQSELLRFTRRGDGELVLTQGHRKGRGAYLCPQESCAREAWRGGRWDRAFRARVRPCGDVQLFWSELLSVLVQDARFLYRSSLSAEGEPSAPITACGDASGAGSPEHPSVSHASSRFRGSNGHSATGPDSRLVPTLPSRLPLHSLQKTELR